jgi:MFS superfamily sulfate permease-like transporter
MENVTTPGRSGTLFGRLAEYPRDWLRSDLIAGLTTGTVVIPKAMAYATIAGLPVEVGLYTAFVPMVIYALLGSSRPLSVSTTTALAILTAAALGETTLSGQTALMTAAATLSVLVGACSCSLRCCGSALSPTSSPSRC